MTEDEERDLAMLSWGSLAIIGGIVLYVLGGIFIQLAGDIPPSVVWSGWTAGWGAVALIVGIFKLAGF